MSSLESKRTCVFYTQACFSSRTPYNTAHGHTSRLTAASMQPVDRLHCNPPGKGEGGPKAPAIRSEYARLFQTQPYSRPYHRLRLAAQPERRQSFAYIAPQATAVGSTRGPCRWRSGCAARRHKGSVGRKRHQWPGRPFPKYL